jgi:phosphoglycolate phosphatase
VNFVAVFSRVWHWIKVADLPHFAIRNCKDSSRGHALTDMVFLDCGIHVNIVSGATITLSFTCYVELNQNQLTMYCNNERLILFDADGTIIDAFSAIDRTFETHGMSLGDLERFQKRHNLFKYLGGLKEFPLNLRKQIGTQSRKKIVATLTDVYRHDAKLYPGVESLIRTLLAIPNVRVGLVTRNITNDPELTIRMLLARHDIDMAEFDFMVHVPLGQDKTFAFKSARARFDINPARSFACGDEHKDFIAAISAGMHPFMVSYGFEDFARLTKKYAVPEEVISRTPEELCARIFHALDVCPPA